MSLITVVKENEAWFYKKPPTWVDKKCCCMVIRCRLFSLSLILAAAKA